MKRGIQMGFNLKKSKTIAPGVKLNFGKKGASVRLGGKGAGVTLGTSGKVTASAGIPGTGLYYTKSKKLGDSDNINDTYSSMNSDNNANGFGYGVEPPEKDDKNKKLWKIAKKIWIVVGVLVLLLILLLVFVNSGDDDEPTTTTEPQTIQAVAAETQSAPTTEAETGKVTEKKTEKQTEKQTQKSTEKQTQPKSQTYMLNENTGKYHKPSCSTINDSKNLREISAEEAKNYSPCGRCKP